MNGAYFLGNRAAVTAWDNSLQSQITYLSSALSAAEVSFSISASDLFSCATYHAKQTNGKTFVFGSGELPKVSTDFENYQSIGTPILENIQIAAGNNALLMTAGSRLYGFNSTTGDMTELHHAENIGYNQIFFENGQFYIFATDYESFCNKIYASSNGVSLEEKAFTFSDADGELPQPDYMEVLQFGYSDNSFRLLLSKGDGYTQLFESQNGIDYTDSSARYSDMLLENVQSYTFGGGSSVVFTHDGYSSSLYYSAGGVNYQASAIENNALISGVIYDENRYIAYGSSEAGSASIYTSPDGETFTKQPVSTQAGEITQLIKAGNGYYAVLHDRSEGITVLYSENLQDFTAVKSRLYYGSCDNGGNESAGQPGGYYRFARGGDILLVYSLDGMIYQKSIAPVPKYTVSYNANGGSGSLPEIAQYDVNTGFTVTNIIPTLANHTFAGWSDGKNIYQKGSSHPGSDSADITLTAVWQENGRYTVTYNPNGGSGSAPGVQSCYAPLIPFIIIAALSAITIIGLTVDRKRRRIKSR